VLFSGREDPRSWHTNMQELICLKPHTSLLWIGSTFANPT
jgi:hypothetical protein